MRGRLRQNPRIGRRENNPLPAKEDNWVIRENMARRKAGNEVKYFVPGRRRPVAGSTVATSSFLAVIHDLNPEATISELRAILTDRSKWLPNPEAIAVLDAQIKAGCGDYVPDWI